MILLASACGEGRVYLTFPDAESRTRILLIDAVPGAELEALVLAPDAAFERAVEGARIVLASYPQTPAELGLEVGALPIADGRPCAVVRPATTFTLRVAGEQASWQETLLTDREGDRLVPDRRDRCVDCRPFQVTDVGLEEISPDATVEGAAPLEDGAIVLSIGDRLARVDRSGALVMSGTGTPTFVSLQPRGGGTFWAGRRYAQIDRLTIHTASNAYSIEEQHWSSFEAFGFRVAVSPAEEPLEVFAVTSSGSLYRYDADGLKHIHDLELSPEARLRIERGLGSGSTPSIIRLGPRHVMAAVEWEQVVEWNDGRVTVHVVAGSGRLKNVADLEEVAGFGVVASTTDGAFFRRAGGGWEPLFQLPSPAPTASMRTFRDGFIFFVRGGELRQWAPGLGVCPEPQVLPGGANKFPREVLLDGRAFVVADLVNNARSGLPSRVIWLDP